MEPPIGPAGPAGLLLAFGNQLVETHIWLREELERLSDDVDAYLDGRGGPAAPPLDLRAHCLTFCSALTRHHSDEDDVAFPAVAQEFPELRPVLEELRRDHELVAGMLHNLQAMLGRVEEAAAGAAEARRWRGELEGLAALLDSHFLYEERKLVSALNSLAAGSLDG